MQPDNPQANYAEERNKLVSNIMRVAQTNLELRKEIEFQRARADKWLAVLQKERAEHERVREQLAAVQQRMAYTTLSSPSTPEPQTVCEPLTLSPESPNEGAKLSDGEKGTPR